LPVTAAIANGHLAVSLNGLQTFAERMIFRADSSNLTNKIYGACRNEQMCGVQIHRLCGGLPRGVFL
jgi:hypothetical protein